MHGGKGLRACSHGCGVWRDWGVIKWYIPPPPGVFRKDINPWELLTNFSQGYHSKRLLDAPVVLSNKLVYGLVFCRSPSNCRPPECEGQRDRIYTSFGHTSILQDGASAFSTIAVLGLVRARQDMRHLSFVKAIPTKPPPFQNSEGRGTQSSESKARHPHPKFPG